MNSNVYKFDSKSDFYNKYRPCYAKEVIDYIISSMDVKNEKIVDIACGTGIFTKQLYDRKCNVIGIEPNKEMYEKACKNLEGIKVLNTTAEETTLESESVDIITVAQALHWFNLDEFIKEARRILKTGGRVAVIYNSIDDSKEIIREYKDIYIRNCKDYNNHNRNYNELFDKLFDGDYTLKVFQNNQQYTYEEFMGYTFSMSYSLKENDENYNIFVKELTELFDKYSQEGIIELPMNSKLAFGRIK
ncbi:MAG: class I SAM-dependent methyltransferase [Clostridia bacterium]|nr:class I SAM-dependent methyltransferase [Clostridia bacterium]